MSVTRAEASPEPVPAQSRPASIVERPRLAWTAPELADLLPRSWATPVVLLVAAVGITLVDVLFMYPAIARAMGHDRVMTWLTALGLGLAALLAAGMAGWTWRGANGNHPGSRAALVLPAGLVLAWAGLGALITWLRIRVSDVKTTVAYEGVQPQVAEDNFADVTAILFLGVYVLCGILTFSDLYHWRNDAYTAGRRAQARLEELGAELAGYEATYQQLLANQHKRAAEIAHLDEDAMTAHRRNAIFADELMQLVRQEISVGLSDPAATGITSPRHPDNPLFKERQQASGNDQQGSEEQNK